jgi:UDP-N-acetylmuramyl pentapeptide phosphotransferase/UDP-N-acetylglucosamine-1-phosphate transferase
VAFRKRLFDKPDERKIHKAAVPRLGGIAFEPAIFFSLSLLLGINMALGQTDILLELHGEARELLFGFCSMMILYMMGMADDLVGIRYRAKFVMQVLCGIMLIAGGMWIQDLHGVFGLHELPEWAGYPLTILVVVFIINAINLIDGIDGLASGLCGSASLLFGFIFFMHHQYIYSLLAFATLGALVPFFYYNVFGNADRGRKIFMGDTGSLTIGMMLSFLSIKLTLSTPVTGGDDTNPMILAFSPLLIPCLDVVRVYIVRIRHGKNPFMPDKSHIHHRMLALGMRQRLTMMTIVFVSIVFTFVNILLSDYIDVNWIVICDILLWLTINITITAGIRRKESSLIINDIVSSN